MADEPDPIPDLVWGHDLDLGPGATPGNVVVTSTFYNRSPFVARAGFGRGMLTVKDSTGSVIHSDWINETNTDLEPEGVCWATANAPLGPGTYGAELLLQVMRQDCDLKLATIEVAAQTVTLRANVLPDYNLPPPDETDPDKITFGFTDRIELSADSSSVQITCEWVNNGEQSVKTSWVQGRIQPQNPENGAWLGEAFMHPESLELAPGEQTRATTTLHLEPGTHLCWMLLWVGGREIAKQTGTLHLEHTDSVISAHWEPGDTYL